MLILLMLMKIAIKLWAFAVIFCVGAATGVQVYSLGNNEFPKISWKTHPFNLTVGFILATFIYFTF